VPPAPPTARSLTTGAGASAGAAAPSASG